MATIKSYTDLEQSKKLAKILPPESADMSYCAIHNIGQETYHCNVPIFTHATHGDIPAWSLAALLSVLPEPNIFKADGLWYIFCDNNDSCVNGFDNPVDACVAMIENLHKLKML